MNLVKVGTAVALTVALASCGEAKLTGSEKTDVATANQVFAYTALGGGDFKATASNVDTLITLYRAKPDARYDGHSMRDVVKDAASTLQPTDPDLARRLDRELK